MFPFVPQQQVSWDDTWLRTSAPAGGPSFGVRDDHLVWPSTPGFAPNASAGMLTANGWMPSMPMQVPMQMHPGWTIPTHFVPLPPSPSMLAATMMPLPPSPRVSPRIGAVALPMQQAMSMPVLGVQQWYNHQPIDPYYLPQGTPNFRSSLCRSCADRIRRLFDSWCSVSEPAIRTPHASTLR